MMRTLLVFFLFLGLSIAADFSSNFGVLIEPEIQRKVYPQYNPSICICLLSWNRLDMLER